MRAGGFVIPGKARALPSGLLLACLSLPLWLPQALAAWPLGGVFFPGYGPRNYLSSCDSQPFNAALCWLSQPERLSLPPGSPQEKGAQAAGRWGQVGVAGRGDQVQACSWPAVWLG